MKNTAFLIAAFLRLAVVVRSDPDADAIIAVLSSNSASCDPVIGEQPPGICAPNCYCIPDDPSDCTTCPSVGNRVFQSASSDADRAFFSGLEVNEASLFRFDDGLDGTTDCNPFPVVAAVLGRSVCTGVKTERPSRDGEGVPDEPVRCYFRYKNPKKAKKKGKGTGTCETGRYSIVERTISTKNSKKTKKDTKVTHEGSCGVCSSAQDLAVNLSPTLGRDAFDCTEAVAPLLLQQPANYVDTFENLVQCFVGLGFSEDCAALWSSNSMNTLLTFGGALQALQGGIEFQGPASCTECVTDCFPVPTKPEWYERC